MTEPDTKVRALLDDLATEARLDPGSERSTLRRARRHRVVAGLVTVTAAAAAVTGGLLVVASVGPRSVPAAPPAPSPVASTPAPSETPATPVETPPVATPTSEPTGPAFATDLDDGRYLVFADQIVRHTDPESLRFDLAIYLTGDEANRYAADHGMEVPVPDDTIIVNDNPKLRLMPLADDVVIRVIAYGECGPACGPNETMTVDGFGELITLDEPLADGAHVGRTAPYWLTIRDGSIVRIEEQYQP
jgi:hypothetical protein